MPVKLFPWACLICVMSNCSNGQIVKTLVNTTLVDKELLCKLLCLIL